METRRVMKALVPVGVLAAVAVAWLGARLLLADHGSSRPLLDVELRPQREVRLEGLLYPRDLAIDGRGFVYAADAADANVKIYDPAGNLVRTVGRKGEGPGEFRRPISVALGRGRFAVGDFNGRISIFTDDGELEDSFVVPGIIHLNSGISFLGDQRLLVGGLRQKGHWEADLLHVFSLDGTEQGSFFSLVDTAKKMRSVMISGAYFDITPEGRIYAVQPSEYTVGAFDSGGKSIAAVRVQASHYHPIPRPEPQLGSREELDEWSREWDKVQRVFVLGPDLLVVSLLDADNEGYRLDFVRASDGRVLRSLPTQDELIRIGADRRTFVMKGPFSQDDATVLKELRVEMAPTGKA